MRNTQLRPTGLSHTAWNPVLTDTCFGHILGPSVFFNLFAFFQGEGEENPRLSFGVQKAVQSCGSQSGDKGYRILKGDQKSALGSQMCTILFLWFFGFCLLVCLFFF